METAGPTGGVIAKRMRKIILNVAVSLDGLIEGPNGEYDWCLADQDYGMEDFLKNTDTIFLGRKSYDILGLDTGMFPGKKIYVFSNQLRNEEANPQVEWVTSAQFDAVVERVLNEPGKNIWLFGGADIIAEFLNKNLVDTLMLSIHPIILGAGKPLFTSVKDRVDLVLLGQKTYTTGLMQATYTPQQKL